MYKESRKARVTVEYPDGTVLTMGAVNIDTTYSMNRESFPTIGGGHFTVQMGAPEIEIRARGYDGNIVKGEEFASHVESASSAKEYTCPWCGAVNAAVVGKAKCPSCGGFRPPLG